MQDGFLFDDSDPKQRGHGCDVIGPDKRLRFKWQWWLPYRARKRKPCQVSEAKLKNGWVLEATFWHTDYEASVEKNGDTVSSYHVRDDNNDEEEGLSLLTRIDAQLKAEQLFEEIGVDIMTQIEQCPSTIPTPLSYMNYRKVFRRMGKVS